MKRLLIIFITLAMLLAACQTEPSPPTDVSQTDASQVASHPSYEAPQFYIFLEPSQGVQAIQLTTSWTVYDEYGNAISGVAFDSPHPLQLNPQDFAAATLQLSHRQDWHLDWRFIGMDFIYGYLPNSHLPHSISVTRWKAEYTIGNQDISDVIDRGEMVELISPGGWTPGLLADMIPIFDDGYDYIYKVQAEWQEGYSVYTFRINSGSHPELTMSTQPIDIRYLIGHESDRVPFDDVRYSFGHLLGFSDSGMFSSYFFVHGLRVFVGDSDAPIKRIFIDYGQAFDRSAFHFNGIDGTSVYDDVITLYDDWQRWSPSIIGDRYTVEQDSRILEHNIRAVLVYGYWLPEERFVEFFFDDAGDVVAILLSVPHSFEPTPPPEYVEDRYGILHGIIDGDLIMMVGDEEFGQWLSRTPREDQSTFRLIKDFDITNEQLAAGVRRSLYEELMRHWPD